MTRTTPDPVLAEATRTELQARVRAEAARRARRDARPAPQRALRPARRDSRQLVIAAAVGAVILAVVLGLGQLRPHPVAAPPSGVASRPAAGPTMSLIVPPGFRAHSDQQLRAWAATLPAITAIDRSVWIEQQVDIVHCMADHGFLFDPVYRYQHAMDTPPPGHEQAYEEALHGRETSDPYNWRNAGCTGEAEHATGQDRR